MAKRGNPAGELLNIEVVNAAFHGAMKLWAGQEIGIQETPKEPMRVGIVQQVQNDGMVVQIGGHTAYFTWVDMAIGDRTVEFGGSFGQAVDRIRTKLAQSGAIVCTGGNSRYIRTL